MAQGCIGSNGCYADEGENCSFSSSYIFLNLLYYHYHIKLLIRAYDGRQRSKFDDISIYSADSGGGGGVLSTNISERRTPLSHLLGCCEPPHRVTLHRWVVLGWGTRQVDQTQTLTR